MSLLRLHSTRSTARLKAVQQTFRPVSSSLLEQNRRSFASTPEGAHQSPPPPSSSSKSTSRSQPKPKTAIPPQSRSSSVSRDQQQTSASRLASSPDSRTAATSEEGGSNGGGDEPFYTADNYIKPTLHVFGTFRKLLVYTSAASVSIAVLVFLGFEGTHLYVEHVSIAPTLGPDDDDGPEEDAVWGWATESQESWTGGRRGGTDPVLGYRARHLIRAAWMAQNWGAGVGGPLQSARNKSDGSATVFNVTAYLASSQFLDQAVALARQNPKVFPQDHHQGLSNAALDLLLLRSRVLERIGTPRSITVARDDLLQIWEDGSVSANRQRRGGIDAARVALKIGDLSYRLKEGDVAVGWWQKAIDYATGLGGGGDQRATQSQLASPAAHVPQSLPPSPLDQRTLVSALVSLSTYYAVTQQLREAESIQRSALRLLSPSSAPLTSRVPDPSSQSLVTRDAASAALQLLFLQHRASVLSVHLAQVIYAASTSAPPPKRTWVSSKATASSSDGTASAQIQLHSAATAAEKVAHALTGVSKPYSGAPSALTHELSSVYGKDKVLSRPAASLLRDARRTAAEAWNLSGMLCQLEGQKEDLGRALECFERAVHWSGGQASAGDPESQVIQQEWATYWKNYTSLKEKLSRA